MKHCMVLVCLLVSGFVLGEEAVTVKDTGQIEVAFSPGTDCEEMIVKHINEATTRVWVQMYNFTNVKIAAAMVTAKNKGLEVIFIGDRSVKTENKSELAMIFNAKIPCYLDSKHPIAHNKICIIDDDLLGTGSFNWSEHAKKNAENYIFITSKAIVALYVANFTDHQKHSETYKP